MLEKSESESEKLTATVFGDEWKRSPQLEKYYDDQFNDWLGPLTLDAFQGQRVLDAGCGKGRHTRIIAEEGAKIIVGVDLSEAVDVAFKNTMMLPNAHIVQANLCKIPFGKCTFDLATCIGVLHHLPEPVKGVKAIANHLRTGGRLAIWVYGCENNAWVQRIRRWTVNLRPPRIPPSLLWGLSVVPAVILYIGLRCIVQPLQRCTPSFLRFIPYNGYWRAIYKFPFKEIQHIVYDQLAPPIAHYVSKDEVNCWFQDAGLKEARIVPVHDNSWAGLAVA